jgi:Lysophospholipase L1 and related esterases
MNIQHIFNIKNSTRSLLLFLIICTAACKKSSPKDFQVIKKPATIVVLGSSTAAGGGATSIDSGWVFRLQSIINKTEQKARFINLAVEGYTLYQAMPTGYHSADRPSPDTARNITKALSYSPDMVMINFPSNDIAANYTDEEILNNYKELTHTLDSARVVYIIFSTQPRDFQDSSQRMRLKAINDKINSLYPLHSNDYLNVLSTSTYSIKPKYEAGDGIHINNSGHEVIVEKTLQQPLLIQLLNR